MNMEYEICMKVVIKKEESEGVRYPKMWRRPSVARLSHKTAR